MALIVTRSPQYLTISLGIFLLLFVVITPKASALQLTVIDPYLEMHTGPGRGYPIFHVIEQDEQVNVIVRRTNWFYVEDRRKRKGWVKQSALGRTMADSGLPAALPETRHGDYLQSKFRVGFNLGTQDDADTTTIVLGYRVFSWGGIEIEGGQIFGTSIDGETYGASIIVEPVKQWRLTPFASYGIGKQRWELKEISQVGDDNVANSDFNFIGAGLNYYIGFNFVVRAEYRAMKVIGQNDTVSNSAWRIGFNSFF